MYSYIPAKQFSIQNLDYSDMLVSIEENIPGRGGGGVQKIKPVFPQ